MTAKIGKKALGRIKEYCIQMKGDEIGGLLTGKVDREGDIIIKDALLLKQEKSAGAFEIDDDDLMDLTKNGSSNLLSSIIGWWHSHGNGDTFWSIIDDECFKRLCEFSGLCFGIVVSNKFEIHNKIKARFRMDIKNKEGNIVSIDNIMPEVDTLWGDVDKEKIRKEIEKKVRDSPISKFMVFNKDFVIDNFNTQEGKLEFDDGNNPPGIIYEDENSLLGL